MSQQSFNAYVATQDDAGQTLALAHLMPDELMPGEVTIEIAYSGLNYKDALALTGRAPVIRRWPMIPGIDLCGAVVACEDGRFQPGDEVIVTGHGIGETHFGGYAQYARVPSDWLVALPGGMSCRTAMAIGTAGLTAMLSLLALEKHGIDATRGPVLVTGASGGVGSIAIALLGHAGYPVTAVTGRLNETDYLQRLGASQVMDRSDFSTPAKALAKERWCGAIDVAGGHTLANVLSQISYAGAVAACGLAESMQLPASVAPFILRAVCLYGIDSVQVGQVLREQAWRRLATDLDTALLAEMTEEIAFADLPAAAAALLAGEVRGRLIVKPL